MVFGSSRWSFPAPVAGLFVASSAYGGCIAINAAHPGERQRWSLAHEHAHFLAQRAKSEVTVLHGYQRVPAAERFADAFAESFLLPASGVQRRFHEVRRSRRERVSPADLLHLADLFQVSLEVLVRRLEKLDLVRPHTWDRLVKAGFRLGEARQMLELAALPPDTDLLPLRYRYLAVEAYLDGAISEGQFARFLRTDRTAARQLAHRLSHRVGLDESGALSDFEMGSTRRARRHHRLAGSGRPVEDLLLDALVAINIVAASVDLEELASASAVRLVMTSVAAAETLWLASLEPGGDREVIDVGRLVTSGALALLDLLDDELEQFVAFAREIDDGEAATFAVAMKRGLAVATDDRRARRLAATVDPPIPIVGTTQLLRTWADANDIPLDRVADLVRSVERRASYVPRRDDPHFAWWVAHRPSS